MDIILYFAALAAMIFALWAQIKVQSTFNKFSRVNTASGGTAAEVAAMILRTNGVNNVRVERVGGNLTDHFDPRSNTLRLSDSVYGSTSAAAIGVAAHEAGHAIQHAEEYLPIKVRSLLVPVTAFSSKLSWIVIIAGLLMMSFAAETGLGYYVTLIGIALFSVTTLFQLVTLPCEFDASRRAMKALGESGRYSRTELSASRKVLTAAALTYVAALAVSLIQLLRLINHINRRR